MYAVIKTGGKQYRVAANDTITVEKLLGETGEHVHFTDVLMIAEGERVEVGTPILSGVTVVGEIAEQVKSPTVYIFKKRRRKHYRRRNGHRQLLTSVRIVDILTGGAIPATKAAAPKKVEAAPAPKPEPKKVEAKKVEPVKAAPQPPPPPVAKVEPVKVEPARVVTPVAAAPVVESRRIEPVVQSTTRTSSHIIETVRGGTTQATEHRVATPVAGGHRTVEIEGDPNEGKDHILKTVSSGQTTTTTSRVATPVEGAHRTETRHVQDTDHSHIVGTVHGTTSQDPQHRVATTTSATTHEDDISLIGGIGPKIAKQLHDKGIRTWAQIADWKQFEIEALNTELKLMGRIEREEWQQQARDLMAGKPPRAKADRKE